MDIPNVTQFSQQPGGGIAYAMQGLNALQQSMLESKIKQAQAQYAPYTEYANAASKIAYSNLLPYEIQSKVLGNPMMWMALQNNPDAINAIIKNFQGAIPANNQVFGNINLPSPEKYTNQKGILRRFFDYLDLGNKTESQNSLATPAGSTQPVNSLANTTGQDFGATNQATDQQVTDIADRSTNALDNNPSIAPGGIQGATNKMTAPYNQQPYDFGKTFSTPAGERTAASAENVAQAQKSLVNVQVLKPVMDRISQGAERFLKPGAKGSLAAGRAATLLEQYGGNILGIPDFIKKKAGVTDDDLTAYAKWKADQNTAIEILKNARTWPNDEKALSMIEDIIKPIPGEGKGYAKRVLEQYQEINKELTPVLKESLRTGISVANTNNNKTEKTQTGADVLSKNLELPSFKNKQEFLDWYNRQPAITQKAVREYLRNK